ncbi:DNA hydrolase, partial [Streptomyces sp. NPDC000405]
MRRKKRNPFTQPAPDPNGSATDAAGEGSVYRQADDYDRRMPYDPSAFPPFAVTVDLVVLTVRRHALCALAVRRGEAPFQGRWALP